MKNKLLVIGAVCLLLTTFVFAVSAEQPETAFPSMENGQNLPQMPQGEMPQGQAPQGSRGQMPSENMEEMPAGIATEQIEPAQTDETNTTQENTQSEQPAWNENQRPEMNMDENVPQRDGFNPMEQGDFPIGQQTQTTEESEKLYEKWITPAVSAVLLIFGFIFVAFYKRKQ